jgi:acyl-CoA thioesterase-1
MPPLLLRARPLLLPGRTCRRAALIATLPLAHLVAVADWATDAEAARANRPALHREFPAVFAPVADQPGLPRVLLIGDSISIGYTLMVRERLAGEAVVHRIPDNGGSTTLGLALLDEWLGDGRWDVIHFNFGLHDITLVDGHPRTPPETYGANLRALVRRLQATGARLVFATTTPVPGETIHPSRREADALVLDRLAREVMAEAGVPLNDLYAFALPQLATLQIPANVHFRPEGERALGERVATAIRTALQSGAPP